MVYGDKKINYYLNISNDYFYSNTKTVGTER